MGSAYTVMTHTQVNFSISSWPEIGVLLLELGVGLGVGKSSISHGKGEGHVVHTGVCNVCGSAHSCGC